MITAEASSPLAPFHSNSESTASHFIVSQYECSALTSSSATSQPIRSHNRMARILTGATAKDYQERKINASFLLFSVNGVQASVLPSFLVKEAL